MADRPAPGAVISEEYRRTQAELHASNDAYGIASVGFAPLVADILNKTQIGELLDYGAGKGRLGQALGDHIDHPVRVRMYEPSRPDWAATPSPAPMVACIDVLEHVEPDCLDAVLDDLKRCVERVGFFTVHTGPAVKVLPDGRNAHLIQETPAWWLPKLLERFDLHCFTRLDNGFWVIVLPKGVSA